MADWNDASLKGLKFAYGRALPTDEGPVDQSDSPNPAVQRFINAERENRPATGGALDQPPPTDDLIAQAKGTIARGDRFMADIGRDSTTAAQMKRFSENNPEDPHMGREFALGALQALRKPTTLATIGTLAAAPLTGGMSLPAGMATIGGAGALGSFAGGVAQRAAGDEDAPASLGENVGNAVGTGVTEAALAGAPSMAYEGGSAALRGLRAMHGSDIVGKGLELATHLPYVGGFARGLRTAQTFWPKAEEAVSAVAAPLTQHAGAATSAARNLHMASTARAPLDQSTADLAEEVSHGVRVPGATQVEKASPLLEPQIQPPSGGRFGTAEQYAKKQVLDGIRNAGANARAGIEARTTAHNAAEADNVMRQSSYSNGGIMPEGLPSERLPESWKQFTEPQGGANEAPMTDAGGLPLFSSPAGYVGDVGPRMYGANQPMQPLPQDLRRLAELTRKSIEAKRGSRPRVRQ